MIWGGGGGGARETRSAGDEGKFHIFVGGAGECETAS